MPESYFVRPNQGVLKQYEKMDVQLSLKAKSIDTAKTNKFSVLALPTNIEPSDTQGQLELWKNPDLTEKQQVVLSVVFSTAEEVKADPGEPEQLMSSSIQASQLPPQPTPLPPQPAPLLPQQSQPPPATEEFRTSPSSAPPVLRPTLAAQPAKSLLSPAALVVIVVASIVVLSLLLKLLGR